MPSIFFIHTNFPAQFGFFGHWLAERGWEVSFATQREGVKSDKIRIIPFGKGREVSDKTHQYMRNTEKAVITGQQVARACFPLAEKGFKPDIVMAHSGWGGGLFVRDIWPQTLYIPYLEWWYNYPLIDVSFLGEHTPSYDVKLRQRIRNSPQMIDLQVCDFGLVPTEFQAAQFPARERQLIQVQHDGVDTALCAPAGLRKRTVAGLDVSAMPEIVTYATRGMEPQRGFPQFMRALEILQKRRPQVHTFIVGEDRVAYGKRLEKGDSWKKRMLKECDLDQSRIHFTGHLPRPDYISVLQASHAHVYLTVPFVLSWSMLEAMSIACPMVVSDTDPVREFMTHEETGLMVDFHSPEAIADGFERLLENRDEGRKFGAAARERIVADYDLNEIAERKRAMLEEALAAKRGG